MRALTVSLFMVQIFALNAFAGEPVPDVNCIVASVKDNGDSVTIPEDSPQVLAIRDGQAQLFQTTSDDVIGRMRTAAEEGNSIDLGGLEPVGIRSSAERGMMNPTEISGGWSPASPLQPVEFVFYTNTMKGDISFKSEAPSGEIVKQFSLVCSSPLAQ